MARYKVQGPNGEIITIEGPDGANPDDVIAQAQALYRPREKTTTDYVKDFGKATASLADTALNAVTGTLDYAAYPMARAFGRTPEQATAETTSPKDVIGRAFGITQDPAYRGETSRQAMGALGQGIEKYAVKPITSATGLPESDVSSMVNTGLLGAGVRAQPYINRGAQAVGQAMYAAEPYVAAAVKAPVQAPVQFGRGLIEGLVNKEYNPATSAQAALQDTYIPPAAAQRFMGEIPGVPPQSISQLQSQARPTAELVGDRMGRVAQAISPKTLAGETLVPLQGQGMQAFGERVGRGVRTNPLQAMGEVGLTALTGVPFKTLAQGVGELGARYLGAKTGFAPGFQNRMTAAQQQAAQQQAFTPPPSGGGGGFTAPPGGYGTPPPPPGGGNAPIAPGQMPPVTPAEAAKQAAMSRVQQQMSQTPGMTNAVNAEYLAAARRYSPAEQVQQAAAERITPPTTDLQARAQAAFGSQYRPPAAEQAPVAAVAAPVAPQTVPKPMVETPVASITTPGPVAPVAMPLPPVAAEVAPVATASVNTPTVKGLGMNTEPVLAEKMSRVLSDEAFNRYSHFTPEQQQLLENFSNKSKAQQLKLIPEIEQIFGNVSAIENPFQPGRPIGLPRAIDPKLQDMYNRIEATKVVTSGPNSTINWDFSVLTPAEVKDYYIKNYGSAEGTPKLKKGQTEEQYWDDPGKKTTVGRALISTVENNLISPTALAVSSYKNLKYGTQQLPLSEAQAATIRSTEPSYTIHYRPKDMPELANRAKQFAEEGGAHDYQKIGPVITERKGNVRVPEITNKKFSGILEQLGGKDAFNIKKEYSIGYNTTIGEEWIRPATATTPTYRLQQVEPKNHMGTKGYKLVEGDNMFGGKEIARLESVEPTNKSSSKKKAPPGVINAMTEEQLKVFNALKRSDSTANLLQQLKESGDPNAKSLAELLEKQGYNNKNK